jgi:hypothetical protein
MIPLASIRKAYDFLPANDGKHKYVAIEKATGHRIKFGDINYEHYKDRLGHYARLDHHDEKRRDNFRSRSRRFENAIGTAGWFAYHLLW